MCEWAENAINFVRCAANVYWQICQLLDRLAICTL